MSIQHEIYLKRAGLLITEESKKTLAQKIKDWVEYLKRHDDDFDVKALHDEDPKDFEDDDKEEHNTDNKKLLEDVLSEKAPVATSVKKPKTREEKKSAFGSNDQGVLHELLVGKYLNNGKHMSKHPDSTGLSPKEAHDKIKAKATPEQYAHHEKRAKAAAADIKKHLESKGHKVHEVHWTSKSGDTERSTGIPATQKQDQSDIVLHTRHKNKKKFVGVGLKTTTGTNKHITASNAGMESTRGGQHIVDTHRTELHKKHPELIGVTNPEKRKEMMDSNPKLKQSISNLNKKATHDLAKHLHDSLHHAGTEEIAKHVRTHVLQANKTPMQEKGHDHIRHTTYQTNKKEGNKTVHHAMDPSHHWNHILNDHKNITIEHRGANVHFLHNGKKFATHRIRVSSSSDPLTSFKTDGKPQPHHENHFGNPNDK